MRSNLTKCVLNRRHVFGAFRRTLCSQKEDNPKQSEKADDALGTSGNQSEEFIELNIPAPRYTNVNTKKSLLETFKEDFDHTMKFIKNPRKASFRKRFIPHQHDVAIFGAGSVGSTLANVLKERLGSEIGVIVIDSDLSPLRFQKSGEPHIIAPQLTLGHVTQQFSLKENILLAKKSMEYFRKLESHLDVFEDGVPTVSFRPFGHLTLATNKGHVMLKENHMQQSKYGVFTELATAYQLSQRFPWLNVDDISIGCLGAMNEGCIDPWDYMLAVRSAAMRRGAFFLEATPLEIHFKEMDVVARGYDYGTYQAPHSVVVKESDGKLREIDFAIAVVALGSETGRFMNDFLHINKKNKRLFSLEVPVTRKKHYVFCFESKKLGPSITSPMVNDPSGVYFRRDGFSCQYICGCTIPGEDPTADELAVDSAIFYDRIWPILVHRVPAFEEVTLKSGWAYFEDYNSFDGSPLVGYHPAFANVMLAAGLGRHSILLAPAIAEAIAEHICDSYYKTIDLTRFGYNRIAQDEPLVEPLIL